MSEDAAPVVAAPSSGSPARVRPSIMEQRTNVRRLLCLQVQFCEQRANDGSADPAGAKACRVWLFGCRAMLAAFDEEISYPSEPGEAAFNRWLDHLVAGQIPAYANAAKLQNWVDDDGQPLGYHRTLSGRSCVWYAVLWMECYLKHLATLEDVTGPIVQAGLVLKTKRSEAEIVALLRPLPAKKNHWAIDGTSQAETALSDVLGCTVRQSVKDWTNFCTRGQVGRGPKQKKALRRLRTK